MKKSLTLFLLLIFNISVSQQDTTNLKEVIVSTSKLEIPFSKNFRTLTVISSNYIKSSPATNVSDLLQEITGIDVRRRGVGGIKAIYIRGGGFDQTLPQLMVENGRCPNRSSYTKYDSSPLFD